MSADRCCPEPAITLSRDSLGCIAECDCGSAWSVPFETLEKAGIVEVEVFVEGTW